MWLQGDLGLFLHMWFSFLFLLSPFVWWDPTLSSRFGSNGHFPWEALHALICCSSFLRRYFPLISISNSSSPREGRKCTMLVLYLQGFPAEPAVGDLTLSWSSLALSLCLLNLSPATTLFSPSPQLILTRTSKVFKIPWTQAVLSSRCLFNGRFFAPSRRLHHGTEWRITWDEILDVMIPGTHQTFPGIGNFLLCLSWGFHFLFLHPSPHSPLFPWIPPPLACCQPWTLTILVTFRCRAS